MPKIDTSVESIHQHLLTYLAEQGFGITPARCAEVLARIQGFASAEAQHQHARDASQFKVLRLHLDDLDGTSNVQLSRTLEEPPLGESLSKIEAEFLASRQATEIQAPVVVVDAADELVAIRSEVPAPGTAYSIWASSEPRPALPPQKIDPVSSTLALLDSAFTHQRYVVAAAKRFVREARERLEPVPLLLVANQDGRVIWTT